MKEIRIDEPGAGEWIMERASGVFRPGMDHSLATFEDGHLRGGFVCCQYLGNSIAIHDGGDGPGWCTRDLLWMVFHYVFCQLHCHKAYAPIASDNYHALDLALRAGWRLETVLRDAVAPGCHLMLLAMEPGFCRWLRIIPQQYLPAEIVERLASHG